jgi:cytochrome c553
MRDQQTHSSIMGAQARGYTDDELLQIAIYFASLPKP